MCLFLHQMLVGLRLGKHTSKCLKSYFSLIMGNPPGKKTLPSKNKILTPSQVMITKFKTPSPFLSLNFTLRINHTTPRVHSSPKSNLNNPNLSQFLTKYRSLVKEKRLRLSTKQAFLSLNSTLKIPNSPKTNLSNPKFSILAN